MDSRGRISAPTSSGEELRARASPFVRSMALVSCIELTPECLSYEWRISHT